jgi:hypothetical protein
VLLLGSEDDVLEVGRRELPALGRAGDVDVRAFTLDAHAVGGRLLLRGETARRAERVRSLRYA